MVATRTPRPIPPPVEIGPLQWRCLEVLYARGGTGTVSDVHRVLAERAIADKQAMLAYTTILTVMRNLVRRKMLTQRPQDAQARHGRGAAHVFQVTMPRAEFLRRRAHLFLESFFGGKVEDLVAAVS